MKTRLVESLVTCSTFFKTIDLFKRTSPWLAMVARKPSTVAIFLLLGYGLKILNFCGEWVIWSIALESMTQEPRKTSKTLKSREGEYLPD